MQTQKFLTPELLAQNVADYIHNLVKQKSNATLVLTSGNTPIRAYQLLAAQSTAEEFADCMIIGLDEWVGVGPENEGSCQYIVEQNLLKPLGVLPENYTFFNGLADDLQFECERIDKLISQRGGLDFIVVGVGMNGHIGLNEPGYDFDNYCHVTELADITIEVGQKYFKSETPLTQGITIGLKHLLEAKTAMLMASGKRKAEIIKQTVSAEISSEIPSTVFQLHKNVLIWLDEAAGDLISD
jgi:galactosamine-6-phosphate isomerase